MCCHYGGKTFSRSKRLAPGATYVALLARCWPPCAKDLKLDNLKALGWTKPTKCYASGLIDDVEKRFCRKPDNCSAHFLATIRRNQEGLRLSEERLEVNVNRRQSARFDAISQ